jgi:hypothetical protein
MLKSSSSSRRHDWKSSSEAVTAGVSKVGANLRQQQHFFYASPWIVLHSFFSVCSFPFGMCAAAAAAAAAASLLPATVHTPQEAEVASTSTRDSIERL